jgi:uncharacterized UPF0160 family protein
MGHQVLKSEFTTVETIQEMKFNKANFIYLQELSASQMLEIKAMIENVESWQRANRDIKNINLKAQSTISYLDKIIQLRDKKVSILKKKVEYLKFRRKIEITVNDVKNAE